MIFTMHRWPDVLTTVTSIYTDTATIVLTEIDGKLMICLPSGTIPLPLQDATKMFLSQPFAQRGQMLNLLEKRPFYVVDTKKSIVRLATEVEAEPFIADVIEKAEFEFADVVKYKQPISTMMFHWLDAQLEYLPLDEDEEVTIYPLRVAAS
jgi:hypothetical protein